MLTSLDLQKTEGTYTNRAMAYIKISKFKEKIVQEFKGKINREMTNNFHNSNAIEMNTHSIDNLSNISSPNQTLYKSKILNDLYV